MRTCSLALNNAQQMVSPAEAAAFLASFCSKRQIQPHYEYEEDGGEFYCEVRAHSKLCRSETVRISFFLCSCECLGLSSWPAGRQGAGRRPRGGRQRCSATSS